MNFDENFYGTHNFTNHVDDTTISFTLPGSSTLNDMISAFESYLKACGYELPKDKYLDFVSPDLDYTFDPMSGHFFPKDNK